MRHYPQRRGESSLFNTRSPTSSGFPCLRHAFFPDDQRPVGSADRALGIYSTAAAPRRVVSVCMDYCHVFPCGVTSTLYLCVCIFLRYAVGGWPLAGCR